MHKLGCGSACLAVPFNSPSVLINHLIFSLPLYPNIFNLLDRP